MEGFRIPFLKDIQEFCSQIGDDILPSTRKRFAEFKKKQHHPLEGMYKHEGVTTYLRVWEQMTGVEGFHRKVTKIGQSEIALHSKDAGLIILNLPKPYREVHPYDYCALLDFMSQDLVAPMIFVHDSEKGQMKLSFYHHNCNI